MTEAVPALPLAVLGWDAEAIRAAREQARALEERDPYAARLLLQQIEVEEQGLLVARARQEGQTGEQQQRHEPYDPMMHLAQMHRRKFNHDELMGMHFPTLFGYTREFTLMEERERREIDKASGKSGPVVEGTVEQVARMAPRAQAYAGDVVPYGG